MDDLGLKWDFRKLKRIIKITDNIENFKFITPSAYAILLLIFVLNANPDYFYKFAKNIIFGQFFSSEKI